MSMSAGSHVPRSAYDALVAEHEELVRDFNLACDQKRKARDERRDAVNALRETRKQAEPREWETSGHPMNEWTRREPLLRIIDDALAKLGETP